MRGDPAATSRLGDLAPLLRGTCPPTTRCARTPTRSSRPALGDQPLRGYLTGSIDVVLRVPDGDGRRYLVVDYKTNWLGDRRRSR